MSFMLKNEKSIASSFRIRKSWLCTAAAAIMFTVALSTGFAFADTNDSSQTTDANSVASEAASQKAAIENTADATQAKQDAASTNASQQQGAALSAQETSSTPETTQTPTTTTNNNSAATTEQQKPVNKPTKAGWMKDADGTWYYFKSVNAKPTTGWLYKAGQWYWLQPDKNGAMAANMWITDPANGKKYWLTGNGPMAKGWVQNGSTWYYTDGSGAKKTSGWVTTKKRWYWLQSDKDGAMATNKWVTDKGNDYWLTSSGAMAKGWVKDGSDWYWTNSSGAKVKNGWVKAYGKWYWLQGNKNGIMLANDFVTDNKGNKYSLASDGAMRSHAQVDLGNSEVGYANNSGAITHLGKKVDGKTVLTNGAGKTLTGWQKIAGFWFYADKNGVAQTGWKLMNGSWYYMDNSAAMVTGSRTIDGKVNFFNGSGKWLGTSELATRAQGYSSNTNYLIMVNRGTHKVGVFKGSKGNWVMQSEWSCVTGAPGSQTITGSFLTSGAKMNNLTTDSRARYCTQIAGGYFFHTILASESELGHSLSHGCIRLAYPNAQWIFNNIKGGTRVVIYN